MSEVLETAQWVAQKGRHVGIDQAAIDRFAQRLVRNDLKAPQGVIPYHFNDGGKATVSYHFLLDSINFCFWSAPGEKRWEIPYDGGMLDGYFALAASFKKAIEQGIPVTNAEYLADISLEDLKGILGGGQGLQLLDRRCQFLRELGRVLMEEFAGEAPRLVEAAENSAIRLVRLLAEKLPSFRDSSLYEGSTVFFYKRAQILVADIYGAFKGKGYGHFFDIDELTAFADYKVPQVLRHLGILTYSSALSDKIDQGIHLEAGSREEVEIRANMICAVERVRHEAARMGRSLKAFEVDWILWNLGQHDEFRARPYHRTVTIYY